MRISKKSKYSVIALADIAIYGKKKPVRLIEIAERQSLPLPYLEQILRNLRKAGVVKSIRGATGGYKLSSPPEKLNINKIIIAIKEDIDITKCNKNSYLKCQKTKCLTHDLWVGLKNTIQQYFEEISLADIITKYLNEQKPKINIKQRNIL